MYTLIFDTAESLRLSYIYTAKIWLSTRGQQNTRVFSITLCPLAVSGFLKPKYGNE